MDVLCISRNVNGDRQTPKCDLDPWLYFKVPIGLNLTAIALVFSTYPQDASNNPPCY